MINFNSLTDDQYKKELFSLIKIVEGVEKEVYKDSKGWPTIGIGFLIKDDNLFPLIIKEFDIGENKNALDEAGKAIENYYIDQLKEPLQKHV